ncbi:uncharacterized protein [Macrobrachium rosenbergii]|uniref:uncharacterized protein n=1 Tax=Macrobrachium rosenbergii TaxID=79674 RepID=UPI0034D4375A
MGAREFLFWLMKFFAAFPYQTSKTSDGRPRLSWKWVAYSIVKTILVISSSAAFLCLPLYREPDNPVTRVTDRFWALFSVVFIIVHETYTLLRCYLLQTLFHKVQSLGLRKPNSNDRSSMKRILLGVGLWFGFAVGFQGLVSLEQSSSEEVSPAAFWTKMTCSFVWFSYETSGLVITVLFIILTKDMRVHLSASVKELMKEEPKSREKCLLGRKKKMTRIRVTSPLGRTLHPEARTSTLAKRQMSITHKRITDLERQILDAEKTISLMMDYFGFPLLLTNVMLTIGTTYMLYFLIDSYLEEGQFNWVIFTMIPTMIFYIGLIPSEVDAFNDTKRKDALSLQRHISSDPYLRESVSMHRILTMLNQRTDFSLLGFFNLGRSCLTTAAGFILTYLIIVLQFRGIKMASL